MKSLIFCTTFSSIEASWPYGLSPGGLPSNGYLGHTFWDQETWMYPTLLLFHQKLARSCLHYRYERMTKARQRARENGYEGKVYYFDPFVLCCYFYLLDINAATKTETKRPHSCPKILLLSRDGSYPIFSFGLNNHDCRGS